MFFTRQNNTNENKVNVNTTVLRSYSDTAQVTFRAWNGQLAIGFAPAIGKDSNGLTQYEPEIKKHITTAITSKNAHAMMEGVNTKLLPAIQNGTSESVSIAAGGNDARKIITLGYDGRDSYIEIATNLNSNGSAATVLRHKLAKATWLSGYDAQSGNYSEELATEAELMEIITRIDQIKELSGMIPHGIKFDDSTRNQFSNKGNGAGSSSTSSQSTYQTQSTYQAPTTNFGGTDLGDYLPFS